MKNYDVKEFRLKYFKPSIANAIKVIKGYFKKNKIACNILKF